MNTQSSGNAMLVAVLLVLAVGVVVYLAGNPPAKGNEAASTKVTAVPNKTHESPPVVNTASPDLSQINPFDYLELIPVGKAAPNFQTKDATDHPQSLTHFQGKKNVVLIFYQGSFCSVCAKQLAGIQANYDQFKALDTEILAISADDKAHAEITLGELGVSFPVIPDRNKTVIKQYGVENIARKGIAYPSAYLVDKKGIVQLAYADEHATRITADELLKAITHLQ